MECSKCGTSFDIKPLYRNAPIGVSCEDWRCIGCLDVDYVPDKTTQDIANIISESNNKPNSGQV